MGLDITAYENLKPAQTPVELDECGSPVDYQKFWLPTKTIIDFVEREFPGRSLGITGGTIYQIEKSFGFRAGSYGGYSSWRDWLANIAGFESAEDVWDSELKEGPFVELINFSDCEGVIGSVAAAKLAKDFCDYEFKAIEQTRDNPMNWNLEVYRQWRKAFEMAANNGAVVFH